MLRDKIDNLEKSWQIYLNWEIIKFAKIGKIWKIKINWEKFR